jgi:hypothetical protein
VPGRQPTARRRSAPGRFVGAGLSLACLGVATLFGSGPDPAAGSAVSAPGAQLGDEGVSALPSGIRRVLADASWLLAIQHYGNRRLEGSSGFPLLGSLIEDAVRLDPELRAAAVAGPLLLAEPPPVGAGEPGRADAILADWVRRHPGDFDAVLVRGLLQSWHLRDPKHGAGILQAASARQDAPPWFVAVAARSLTSIGARAEARDLWGVLLERAGDDRTRSNARTHLLQLDALERLDALATVIGAFEQRSGKRPDGWNDLIAAGLLSERPSDPTGVPFVLNETGLPQISRKSALAGYPGR